MLSRGKGKLKNLSNSTFVSKDLLGNGGRGEGGKSLKTLIF